MQNRFLIIFVLCLSLLAGCTPTPSLPTDTDPADTSSVPVPTSESTEPDLLGSEQYRRAPYPYLPFISDGSHKPYIETKHNLAELPLDALYVLDKQTDTLTQICPGPIYLSKNTEDHIYYILEAEPDRIYRCDYTGQEQTVIYQTEGVPITAFSYWGLNPNGRLCVLIQNSHVLEYNIAKNTFQLIMERFRIDWAEMYYDNGRNEPYLEWSGKITEDGAEKTYWYYFQTDKNIEYTAAH